MTSNITVPHPHSYFELLSSLIIWKLQSIFSVPSTLQNKSLITQIFRYIIIGWNDSENLYVISQTATYFWSWEIISIIHVKEEAYCYTWNLAERTRNYTRKSISFSYGRKNYTIRSSCTKYMGQTENLQHGRRFGLTIHGLLLRAVNLDCKCYRWWIAKMTSSTIHIVCEYVCVKVHLLTPTFIMCVTTLVVP